MLKFPHYYLVASSSSFFVPSLYGFLNGHRVLPTLSLLLATSSMTYWLDPTNQTNEQVHLFVSKIAGTAYFFYGMYTITSVPLRVIGYMDIVMILSNYNASYILYRLTHDPFDENNLWIPHHMAFHLFASLGQFIALL